jgi:ferredoxin
MRKNVEIDDELCDGCGQCVPACAEGAIEIVDGKARLAGERYCDGLGACMGDCPNGALRIVEREAEDFDEEAVEARMETLDRREPDQGPVEEPMACGCPSSQIRMFQPSAGAGASKASAGEGLSASALSHWPVQIRLVPPDAPFLKGADLVVAADCTPFVYPDFHRDFLAGKALLVGCPKFDDPEDQVSRLARIFQVAEIRSITAVVMEVPCCSALPVILEKAMGKARKTIPMEVVVLGTQGGILERRRSAAA